MHRHPFHRLRWALLFTSLLALPTAMALESIIINPAQDNTLYETAINSGETQNEVSNGAGNFLFAGRTGFDGGFKRRRALLQFDLQATLPVGVTIKTVELLLYQSKAAPDSPPAVMGLHRVLQAWGEGDSIGIPPEGQGNYAEPGDASWHHRLFPDELWDTAGGSYYSPASAITTVGTETIDFTWLCTAALLADVKFWQQNPEQNFGWVLVGGEAAGQSAHRFISRENSTTEQRPRLIIYYEPETYLFSDGFEAPQDCG